MIVCEFITGIALEVKRRWGGGRGMVHASIVPDARRNRTNHGDLAALPSRPEMWSKLTIVMPYLKGQTARTLWWNCSGCG